MVLNFSLFDQLLNPFFLLKIGFLLVIFIYIIFSLVVLNQVSAMNNIIKEVRSSAIIFFLAILNLFLAVSLFIIALVIL